MIKLRKSSFLEKALFKHNELYSYDLHFTNIRIKCKNHGWFEQTPKNHLKGSGCPLCANIKRNKKRKFNKDIFIEKSKALHGETYDYRNVKYVNCDTKVEIICSKHGSFFQSPYCHYKVGNGCIKCAEDKNSKNLTKKLSTFIKESSIVHDNYYSYNKSNYKGAREKLLITCPKHGDFLQTPSNHLKGKGCKKCSSSKGEKFIRKTLKESDIKFEEQKSFEGCRNKLPLSFDFYLPDHNMCIEYNGIQHYEPVKYFGGKKAFEIIKKRDNIKRKFCDKNQINMINIKYDNISKEIILSELRKSAHRNT